MAQLAPLAPIPGNQVINPDAPVWAMRANGVTLKVELALGWGNDPSFTLDDPANSQLDTAVLGSADAPWLDVSCDIRSLEFGMGASNIDGLLTRWEAGSAQIILGNEDDKYNTENLGKRLLPMVKVRITATSNGGFGGGPTGTVFAMWYGYADSFTMAWDAEGDSTVTCNATDGTKLLSNYDVAELSNPVGDGETAAQRAKRILDAASWPDGLGFSPNDGGTLRMGTTMGADSWTQLLLNQDAELGATYIDTAGRFVFKPRDVWVTDSLSATYDAQWGPNDLRYENVALLSSETELRNIVGAARPGSTEQTVQDANSIARFLRHTYSRDDLPFTNDQDSLTWANLVLQTSAWPEPRIDSLEVLPQIDPNNLWPVVMSVVYGAKWLVTIQTPGMDTPTQAPCQVLGWKHKIDREQWRITYALMQAPVTIPFVLDGSDEADTLDSMRLTDSAITSISPPQATGSGTTGLQINGKGFAGATDVKVGTQSLRAGFIALDTRINGYLDAAQSPGLVSVVVTTPSGVIQSYLGFTLT